MKNLLLVGFLNIFQFVHGQVEVDSIIFYFDQNSSYLQLDKATITKLQHLQALDVRQISIHAYTDTVGGSNYNLWLANRRADRVKELVQDLFVQPQITITGATSSFGPTVLNRRVSLYYRYIPHNAPEEQIELISNDSLAHLIMENEDALNIMRLTAEKISLNLAFKTNQAKLRFTAHKKIKQLIRRVETGTYSRIELHGHVCCGDNYLLSLNRAIAVRSELEKAGVNYRTVFCYGHSNKVPLVEETNRKTRKVNRRVEVLLMQ